LGGRLGEEWEGDPKMDADKRMGEEMGGGDLWSEAWSGRETGHGEEKNIPRPLDAVTPLEKGDEEERFHVGRGG